jgi:hypothetical protein
MPNGRRHESPTPPDWWNPSLYSFVTVDFPLEGWVWEFMRRDRLREVLCGRPVDAMNPNPDLESIEDSRYWNYYKPANHPHWETIGKAPYFLPPAVNIPGQFPIGFQGQQYRLEDDALRQLRQVNIDINRRDSTIFRDFTKILSLLRNDFPEPPGYPEPPPMRPKPDVWFDNRILQVWDLRQFNVVWPAIAELYGFSSPPYDREYGKQKAINSYNTAYKYIDNRKYKELARYIDL